MSLLVPDKNGNMVDVVLGMTVLGDMPSPVNLILELPLVAMAIGSPMQSSVSMAKNIYWIRMMVPTHCMAVVKAFILKYGMHSKKTPQTIVFTYVSPDGDAGYPGKLTSKVTFTLTDENALQIDYEATTEAKSSDQSYQSRLLQSERCR